MRSVLAPGAASRFVWLDSWGDSTSAECFLQKLNCDIKQLVHESVVLGYQAAKLLTRVNVTGVLRQSCAQGIQKKHGC
jgi:hypothetical protein